MSPGFPGEIKDSQVPAVRRWSWVYSGCVEYRDGVWGGIKMSNH